MAQAQSALRGNVYDRCVMNQISQKDFQSSRRRMGQTKWVDQSGFTLLELLLVIALIGILATVSVGRYNRHVQESNRRAAVAQLYALQQTMERNRLQSGQYSRIADQTIKGYVISSTVTVPTVYELKATPIANDGGDMSCGTLSIDQQDKRTASEGNSVACWQ